ncbi:S9 family peptidase [Anaerobacillus sp. 1_MG-2023]|uniref:alpha/beta hydrolase family protein n=1 Tax=Bacillales TaxID=1385 RepID=UPI0026E3DC71|nr:alpha/beta hydrolase [Anaerobacillus sp. 1_MG-2023]MDO6657031.1 alpha/beta hydrolase [Anaerobacillus sp. 1_MG-2023]
MEKFFYGENENQFGELRLPEGEGPFPVAIVIHGGFWRKPFTLEIMREVAEDLTASGFATWNIEYRRTGQEGGGYPGTLTDAAEATDYIRTLAESFPLDLNKVVTIGHSAGGHLATWIAARHRMDKNSELFITDTPLPIHGVVSLAGVNDLEMMHGVHEYRDQVLSLKPNNPTAELLGGSPKEYPERYKNASPVELLPLGVQQILVHGALDINVPIGISDYYQREAEGEGDFVKLIELPSAEHFVLTNTTSFAWETIKEELSLLVEY